MRRIIEELEARVERVERANRRLRAWGGCALVVLALGAFLGASAGRSEASAGQTITASRFELVDLSGQVRGYFGVSNDGTPHLSLLDDEGNVRLGARVSSADSPQIGFLDDNGDLRGLLGVNTDATSKKYLRFSVTKFKRAGFYGGFFD